MSFQIQFSGKTPSELALVLWWIVVCEMTRIVGLGSCRSLPRYRGWDFQTELSAMPGVGQEGVGFPVSLQSLPAGMGSLCRAEIRAGKKSSSPQLTGKDMGHLVGREINSWGKLPFLVSRPLPPRYSLCICWQHKSYRQIILLKFRKQQQKSSWCKTSSGTNISGI